MQEFFIDQFLGRIPKLSPKLLPTQHAQIATNCQVKTGRLQPVRQPKDIQLLTQGSAPKSLYNLDGTWLSWDSDVDVEPSLIPDVYEEMVEQYCTGGSINTLVDTKINFIQSGILPGMKLKNLTNVTEVTISAVTTTTQPNDTLNFPDTTASVSGNLYQVIDEDTVDFRFYYTGDGAPKQSNKTLALPVPVTSGPAQEYNLGIRKPSTILNVQIDGAGDGTVEKTVVYTYTFVNLFGEESEPSNPTAVVDLEGGQTTTLSNILIPVGGLDGVEYVRIYRSVTGTNTAQYQMVEQLPASDFPDTAATYADTVTDSLLGNILQSSGYKAPPEAMVGLCKFNNMVYAGFWKNTVYFSEPNRPHAWPHTYDLPYEIVGIESFDNQLIVLTTDIPYVIFGEDPLGLSVTPLPIHQPAFTKRGITATPLGVAYVCPDGIQLIANSTSYKLLTEGLVDRDYWNKDSPWELVFYAQTLCLMEAGTNTGACFNPYNVQEGLFDINLAGTSTLTGWLEDSNELFVISEDAGIYTLQTWDTPGEPFLPATWKSKLLNHRVTGNYQTAKVISNGDVTVSYEIDSVVQNFAGGATKTISDGDNFRLPGTKRGRTFSIEISFTSEIDYVGLAGHSHGFA